LSDDRCEFALPCLELFFQILYIRSSQPAVGMDKQLAPSQHTRRDQRPFAGDGQRK